MLDVNDLAGALRACREAGPEWQPLYDEIVAHLRATGAGSASPRVGDAFPDFMLADAHGRFAGLSDLIADGPLVLSINRGGWCPYCRSELTAWRHMLPALAAKGATFAVVTGEVAKGGPRFAAEVGLDATILYDMDHGLALQLGLAFRAPDELIARYRDWGVDLAAIYGNLGGLLPIPATYAIGTDGAVRYAFADPDFRRRAEPAEVLAALG